MRAAHLSLQLARPKCQSHRQSVCECVCGSGVCKFKCVCVSQSVSLWLIMRTSLNKSSTTFQCHCRKLKDHSLISLAGGCWLCAYPSTPLCACSSSPLSLSLALCLPLFPICACACHSLSVRPACLPVVGASIILCRHNLTTGNAAHSKGKNDTYTRGVRAEIEIKFLPRKMPFKIVVCCKKGHKTCIDLTKTNVCGLCRVCVCGVCVCRVCCVCLCVCCLSVSVCRLCVLFAALG